MELKKPQLYVVATPIGCLGDISERAKTVLAKADLIAAEDTRTTRKLLGLLEIEAPELISYYDGKEVDKAEGVISRIKDQGLSLALVSEAGTPGISDPGYHLVRQAHLKGVPVSPVPGASALTSIVMASGLASDRVLFVGFLPTKEKALREEVASWQGQQSSVVFLESGRRIKKTLKAISDVFPKVNLTIGRELTKMHEEVISLTIDGAVAWAEESSLRGELTVMLDKAGLNPDMTFSEEKWAQVLSAALSDGFSVRDIVQRYKGLGLSRDELYNRLLNIKES